MFTRTQDGNTASHDDIAAVMAQDCFHESQISSGANGSHSRRSGLVSGSLRCRLVSCLAVFVCAELLVMTIHRHVGQCLSDPSVPRGYFHLTPSDDDDEFTNGKNSTKYDEKPNQSLFNLLYQKTVHIYIYIDNIFMCVEISKSSYWHVVKRRCII